jgi:HAD superfamily hydrolase (TIGR01484 family)
MAIKLISTDFDGTLFAEFENPPVPVKLQNLIGQLQAGGATWVINTGRDLSSLLETTGRARLTVKPDFVVIVEREIYRRHESEYVEDGAWNQASRQAHGELFLRVEGDLPRLRQWVEARYKATIYQDIYSPFCFIAESNADAEAIHQFLDDYCREVPNLTVVRNDIYARLSHEAFNKGTALAEIARQLGIDASETFAVGDHLNDVPMLSRRHAHWLGAPANAVETVKTLVRGQEGHVSGFHCGHGVADALEVTLNKASAVAKAMADKKCW